MRMSELKRKEVINVCDCRRLGFVGDMEFDPCTGQIKALIVPGPGCVCGFLGREKEFVIPFEDVCQMGDTKVIDSRPADDNSSIRRRRQCEQCGRRFTTYEKLETMPLMIIKKDDSRETYDRSKLEKGILLSCHKRPVSSQEISAVIDEIENQIFNMGEREIPASLIGELVMKKLKDVDEVAYVRFASVYREFKDVNAFMEELAKFLNNK